MPLEQRVEGSNPAAPTNDISNMYRGFGIIVSALLTRRRGEFSTRFPPRGGLAEAIRYALARWPALCRFLDDGRIELDTNAVERAIRPVALGQKNHLFARSEGGADRWAIVASLLATAKLNGIEP
mgnify:FL=1